MKNKPTLTIAVSAYNEEDNIGYLIEGMLKQKADSYTLEKIIVSSDASTDRTNEIVRSWEQKNSLIKLIENPERKGKAARVNEIRLLCESDILVVLDADIFTESSTFVEELASEIMKGYDLVSAKQRATQPKGFFEKVLYSGTILKSRMYAEFNNGNNIYSCQGHSRAFSKRFYKDLVFRVRVGEDAYSYLFCISHGYKYALAKNAVAQYKLPDNFRDHQKQSVRFFRSTKAYEKEFGKDFIRKCYNIPAHIVVKNVLRTLREYPLHLSLYFALLPIMKIKSLYTQVPATWDMSTSTKKVRAD